MKRYSVLAIVLLVGASSLAACQIGGPAPVAAPTAASQSAATPLPAVGGALDVEARVVPVQSAGLSVPVGGIVAEVLVVEGDSVEAGQPLLRLEQARAEASVAQAEADLRAAQAAYEKLSAGATPEEIAAADAALSEAQAHLRRVRGGVTGSDIAAAVAALEQARAAEARLQGGASETDVRQARAALVEAQANARTQRDSLSAAKVLAQSQMEQAANALRDRQADYSRIYWDNRDLEGRSSRDLPQERKDAEAAALRAMQNADEALRQARVAYAQAQQAEVSGVAAAEARVQDAQAGLDRLVAGADADELAAARARVASSQADLDRLQGDEHGGALAAAEAQVAQAGAALAGLRAGASKGDLAVAAAEMERAEAALALARAALAETELRAPFAGTVAAITPRIGEFVAPGSPLVDLADLSSWQVETTDLTEQHIVRVREGRAATVTFDAIPDLELHGVVEHIRPLGENRQGDITYAVRVRLDEQDPRLRWNMTASVAIEPEE